MKHWFMQTERLAEQKHPDREEPETTAEDVMFQGVSIGIFKIFAEMDGGEIFIKDGGIWRLFREQDYYETTTFLYSKKDWDGHACFGH